MAADEGNHAGLRQGIHGCGRDVGSGLGVHDDRLELRATHAFDASGGIDRIDCELGAGTSLGAIVGEVSGQRLQYADFDGAACARRTVGAAMLPVIAVAAPALRRPRRLSMNDFRSLCDILFFPG